MNNPMGVAVCTAGAVCRVGLQVPVNWVPPLGSLVTFSPRIWSTEHPIPTFYKGSHFVFNSSR